MLCSTKDGNETHDYQELPTSNDYEYGTPRSQEFAEGELLAKQKMATQMLAKGYPKEVVFELTGVSLP